MVTKKIKKEAVPQSKNSVILKKLDEYKTFETASQIYDLS